MVGPRIVVIGRHRPHEALLLLWAMVLGIAGLVVAPTPGSINALVPFWEVQVWSVLLALSGVVGLPGYLVRRTRGGLWLEMAGMLAGAGAIGIYCIAIIAAAGWSGVFGATFFGAWTLANLLRCWQIRSELRGWR